MASAAIPSSAVALAALALGLLAGCATAPDEATARGPQAPQVVSQTVYVPVYVEVEKPSPPPPAPEPVKLPEEHEQSLALLLDMAKSAAASADDLRKDFAAAQTAFNKDRTPVNRLRYAWLSALMGPGAGDDARLQGLLEPLVAKTGGLGLSHPLRPIADVLLAQLAERTRQVRDEQKKADALQQKLDALKAIEKQLLDRERRRN